MHEFVYQNDKKVVRFAVTTKVNLESEENMKAMLQLLLNLDWKHCKKVTQCSTN